MADDALLQELDAYLDANWDTILQDITTLVQIPSVEELDKAVPGAPFGPGPQAALTKVLEIANAMGFETHDCEGYMGYADFPGETATQLGIIGHMDVVPDGPGWHFPAYDVTEKDGYLIGRGTLDDKGPSVIALHAMKFWKDKGVKFPYTIRFLFGTNEETGMNDVVYYREHNADPAFLITPDAEFPVCYGEKGGFDATITSVPMPDRVVRQLTGGAATNAVPGEAEALVYVGDFEGDLPGTEAITVERDGEGYARIMAKGKSAHASMPETGVNAIGLLIDYLLENDLCTSKEREFFTFERQLLDHTDGSGVGLKTSDEYFGPLTIIGGTIKTENDCFIQTVDSRFPTSTSGDEILETLTLAADKVGASVERTLLMVPFLVKPDTPQIQALLQAYNDVTGEDAKPFTMGGGTYAREFTSGASFGPEMPWVAQPDWVGSMHGPDEGVSIELLRETFRIYGVAIQRLMEIDL